jgi:hypothetical protein
MEYQDEELFFAYITGDYVATCDSLGVRQASKIRFESCGYLLQLKGAGSMVQNGSEEIKRKRRITSTLYRQMELGFSMQHETPNSIRL